MRLCLSSSRRVPLVLLAGMATLTSALPCASQSSADNKIPRMPTLLSQREQMDVRENWLRNRLGSKLLPMMKRHGIEMWIVVNSF